MSRTDVADFSDRTLRAALGDIAVEMARVLGALNTKDGVFLKDQGRQLVVLNSQVESLLREQAAAPVLSVLRSNLSLILDATLAEHRSLGAYRPEVTQDLARVMSSEFSEIANAIVNDGSDLMLAAVRRAVAGGAKISSLAGPIARALDTTHARAVVAIQRAIREMHEQTLKRMGDRHPLEMFYVYVGPPASSPNIRPYCAERTGKALTQRAADALEPRKRFNCRHNLAPMPGALVEMEGLEIYDTKRKRSRRKRRK